VTQQMQTERTEEVAAQEPPPSSPEPAPAAPAPAQRPSRQGLGSLDRLAGIEVRAAVELGSRELLVRELAGLGPGSVVQLDRLVGEPADLTVNGMLFARGEVVVVDDHLGLRVTELVEAPGEEVASG
jgi:flagellar motor switch protein FliN/FliY